ncbi:MAG: FtsW/RodA/SpoVE family cell cycle protein [Bacillota bacterium]
MNKLKKIGFAGLFLLVILFELSAFSLLAFRDGALDPAAAIFGGILTGLILIQYAVFSALFRNFDRLLLVLANFLTSFGFIVQYRIGADIAEKQLLLFGVGIVAMIVCVALMRAPGFFRKANWLMLIGGIGILMLVLVLGQEQYGAKNWLDIGGFSFQPSELSKVALVFVLAHRLAEPDKRKMWPILLYVFACVGLLMLERDLGAAVLIAGVSLIVYFVATGNKRMTAAGLLMGAVGAVGSYFIFDHVRVRVAIWRNPWAAYSSSGYQIAQGLMAIASGGLWGSGLALGSPKLIPAYHTDYIFAVICEEFGIIVGLCVILTYAILMVRGVVIALNAPDRFTMLVAFGATMLFALQSFIIIAGVTKLIPLTGITMPLVSYGGSSLIASMMLLGILQGVAILGGEAMHKAVKEVAE